jgi:hypothetical protein
MGSVARSVQRLGAFRPSGAGSINVAERAEPVLDLALFLFRERRIPGRLFEESRQNEGNEGVYRSEAATFDPLLEVVGDLFGDPDRSLAP